MGQVTILNGINVPVNSCISAVANLSWCNKLAPKTYYQHNAAISIVTLNVNYWFGEQTEFSSDPGTLITTIVGAGTAVAGAGLAVVGLVLTPFSVGATLALTVAGAALVVSGVGVAVSGISMMVNDFNNQLCKETVIPSVTDPKYIVEGADDSGNTGLMVTLTQSTAADGTSTITYTNTPTLKLRQLSDTDYQTYLDKGGYTEHLSQPLVGEYLTLSELSSLHLLNVKAQIYPALGGTCSWEISNDSTDDGAVLDLWGRGNATQAQWVITEVDSTNSSSNTYYLYNPALGRYATCDEKIGSPVTGGSGKLNTQMFKIMKAEVSDSLELGQQGYDGPWLIFLPVVRPDCAIIYDNGNLGNRTSIVLASATTTKPAWALWKVTTV
jgi:hypothetical protein